jgi:NTE family protein
MPFGSEGVQEGIGLALSGGGFRATLFHLGSLWRLNELGYLPKLDRISSVSGGSITSGLLACCWNKLTFQNDIATNFHATIVEPLRYFCQQNIDEKAVIEGFLPWEDASDVVLKAYEKYLFGGSTLQHLPNRPWFVFNTTNFQTGVDFRFCKAYAGDYRLGLIPNPQFSLSLAVAASSAFPPVLSPVAVDTDPAWFQPVKGADLHGREEYCRRLYLTDGGVYDNLGLETVWNRYKTLLVSDAGTPLNVGGGVGTSWKDQALRAMDITTNQARALRKRALIADFDRGERKGTYWGIQTNINDYQLGDYRPGGALFCDPARVGPLAWIRTRLDHFNEEEQCRLINWGYALCDAAVRRWVLQGVQVPHPGWPCPTYPLS